LFVNTLQDRKMTSGYQFCHRLSIISGRSSQKTNRWLWIKARRSKSDPDLWV